MYKIGDVKFRKILLELVYLGLEVIQLDPFHTRLRYDFNLTCSRMKYPYVYNEMATQRNKIMLEAIFEPNLGYCYSNFSW